MFEYSLCIYRALATRMLMHVSDIIILMHKNDTQDVFSLSPTLFVAPLVNDINHNDSSLMTQLDYNEKWPYVTNIKGI